MTANIENKAYNKKSPAEPKAGRIIGITLCYIFLILICFTCVFPFLWMFLSSLKTVEEAVNTLTLRFSPKPRNGTTTPWFLKKSICSADF